MKILLLALGLLLLPAGSRPRDGIDAFFGRLDEAEKWMDDHVLSPK